MFIECVITVCVVTGYVLRQFNMSAEYTIMQAISYCTLKFISSHITDINQQHKRTIIIWPIRLIVHGHPVSCFYTLGTLFSYFDVSDLIALVSLHSTNYLILPIACIWLYWFDLIVLIWFDCTDLIRLYWFSYQCTNCVK